MKNANHIGGWPTMAKLLLLGFILCLPYLQYGQIEPMYSQYIFNPNIINPAQSGASTYNTVGALYRQQWVGLDGAPVTRTAFLNTSLGKDLGLGVGVVSDAVGPVDRLSLHTDFAYHLKLSSNWRLSAGLRFMVNNVSVNLVDLENVDPDVKFSSNLNSGYYLNAGFGFLLQNKNFYAGFSLPKAVGVYLGGENDFFKRSYDHMVAYAGGDIPLSRQWSFLPSVLIKQTRDVPVQLDFNAVFNWQDAISLGGILRSRDGVGLVFGITPGEHWTFGYVYEYPINEVNTLTWQSHEISLTYRWARKDKHRIRSPRFFL